MSPPCAARRGSKRVTTLSLYYIYIYTRAFYFSFFLRWSEERFFTLTRRSLSRVADSENANGIFSPAERRRRRTSRRTSFIIISLQLAVLIPCLPSRERERGAASCAKVASHLPSFSPSVWLSFMRFFFARRPSFFPAPQICALRAVAFYHIRARTCSSFFFSLAPFNLPPDSPPPRNALLASALPL